MNIIQAREAALEGKTVISPSGLKATAVDFKHFDDWTREDIFGEWREKREPRVRWMNEYSNGFGEQSFISKESADKNACKDRIACVKFIESLDDQA